MTRRSITAVLGSLLVALLVTVNVSTVGANAPCSGYAQEHCETIIAADSATLFSLSPTLAPVHVLSGNGMGQEQFEALAPTSDAITFSTAPVHILAGNGMGQELFEATEDSGYGLFVIAGSSNGIAHIGSGYAPENYEQMTTANVPSN